MPQYTFYAPGPGDRMEGGFETSRKNREGENIPRTLDDFRLGKSDYVTLASDPSRYGESVDLGNVKYRSPIDQKEYTLSGVKGLIHDTGSAFRGRPDKLDIATGDFRGWSPSAASNFVARNSVGGGSESAAPMAYAGEDQQDPKFDPARMLLSALGGGQQVAQAAPSGADRFGAGLQSFLGGENLPGAIGGLLSGLATGQRQDPGYLDRQNKDRAFNELVRQHNQQSGHQNETLAENRRQFELQYNKPQVVFKKVEDPDTGEMIDQPYIVTPGGPGKPPNVLQLDPSTFKPQVTSSPPQQQSQAQPDTEFSAQSRVPGLNPEQTAQIPSVGVPSDVRGAARREYLKTMAQGRAKADLQKTLTAEGDKTQNDVVRQNLDKAITKVNESPFLTTGLVGQLSGGIGGTPAHDLSAMIEPIEANIAFDRLNKIRQENARGSGIGNVTDKDMALLKSVLGSLKQSQTSNELLFNLERLRQTYHKITDPLAPPLPPLARMQRPQQAPMAPAARTGGAERPPLSSFGANPNAL